MEPGGQLKGNDNPLYNRLASALGWLFPGYNTPGSIMAQIHDYNQHLGKGLDKIDVQALIHSPIMGLGTGGISPMGPVGMRVSKATLEAVRDIAKEYGFTAGERSNAYTGSSYQTFYSPQVPLPPGGRNFAGEKVASVANNPNRRYPTKQTAISARVGNHPEPVARVLQKHGAQISLLEGEPFNAALIRNQFQEALEQLGTLPALQSPNRLGAK